MKSEQAGRRESKQLREMAREVMGEKESCEEGKTKDTEGERE